MAMRADSMTGATSDAGRRRRTGAGAGRGVLPRRGLAEPMRRLVADARLELIPMASLERAVGELPPGAPITMTCSPVKGIDVTLDESARLIGAGHHVVPHLSARMVRDDEHLAAIRRRLVDLDVREVFVVAGDADPPGRFFDAIEFLEAFLALDDADGPEQRQVDHVGFTAYPDSHPLIDDDRLHEALHRKQRLVLASGRTGHVSTQMCFSADRIRDWLRHERASGLTVPVHLGVPGVIDRTKLLTMGVRLGVGTSLRYLRKNRRAIGSMMTQRSYQPEQLLRPLADAVESLGIGGIHLFTFNQVAATEEWRTRALR